MPMLLSEERAEELVNEWIRDCGGVRAAKSTVASCGSPATHLEVSPDFRFHDFAASNELGESLRRAMEGLNALASCAGLDPSENPAFWRRQFQVFERTFVSRDTMARYTIKLEYTANVNASGVACVLATCLGMRSMSKGIAIRERELAVLREYLVRTPPMLEINVDLAVRSRDPYCEDPVWHRFGRSLRDIYSLWIMEGECGAGDTTRNKVPVVIGHEDEPVEVYVHKLTSRLTAPNSVMELQEFHCATDDSGTAELLAHLARKDTLRVLSLSLDTWKPHFLVAVCSALPFMKSLSSLTLSPGFSDLRWLVYALRSRRHRGGCGLSLQMSWDAGAGSRFEDAMQQPNCLESLVPWLVRAEMDPTIFPIGTTAVVPKSTKLETLPFLDGPDYDGLTNDRWCLDVIARSESRVLAVIPGVGFRWVQVKALEHKRVSMTSAVNLHGNPLALDALVCDHGKILEIVTVLQHVGRELSCLHMRHYRGTIPLRELLGLVQQCPQLTKLVLSHIQVSSPGPLVDALALVDCKITTLVVVESTVQVNEVALDDRALLATLCDPRHAMATTLESLCFLPYLPLAADDRFVQCIRPLAASRRLRLLWLSASPDLQHELAMAEVWQRPLLQETTSKRALYGFVSVLRKSQWLPHSCQLLIAAFAATRPRRQVVT